MVLMKNNDKAFVWSCNDCSEEAPSIEKLAVRLQTAENANLFKAAFEAAKKFNQLVREEKTEGLEFAPVVEDLEEKADDDDPDQNKTADADGEGDKNDE